MQEVEDLEVGAGDDEGAGRGAGDEAGEEGVEGGEAGAWHGQLRRIRAPEMVCSPVAVLVMRGALSSIEPGLRTIEVPPTWSSRVSLATIEMVSATSWAPRSAERARLLPALARRSPSVVVSEVGVGGEGELFAGGVELDARRGGQLDRAGAGAGAQVRRAPRTSSSVSEWAWRRPWARSSRWAVRETESRLWAATARWRPCSPRRSRGGRRCGRACAGHRGCRGCGCRRGRWW